MPRQTAPIARLAAALFAALLLPLPLAAQERSPAPSGAEAYIIEPADGAVVQSPLTVRFGLRGMGVAPAGIEFAHTGHHHLLVDVEELPPLDQPIPADDRHIHFGKGQTEVSIELTPGRHSLQLLLGDHLHRPHDPPVLSPRIHVTVEGKAGDAR